MKLSKKTLSKVRRQIKKKYSPEYLEWKEELDFNRKYGSHISDNDVSVDDF